MIAPSDNVRPMTDEEWDAFVVLSNAYVDAIVLLAHAHILKAAAEEEEWTRRTEPS